MSVGASGSLLRLGLWRCASHTHTHTHTPRRTTNCRQHTAVGNSLFPLLESSAIGRFYCCDFAETAVRVLRANEAFDGERVVTFVADISVPEQVMRGVPPQAADLALLIFVLSALDPDLMPSALLCARDHVACCA